MFFSTQNLIRTVNNIKCMSSHYYLRTRITCLQFLFDGKNSNFKEKIKNYKNLNSHRFIKNNLENIFESFH